MSWLDSLNLEQKHRAYNDWQNSRIENGYERSTMTMKEWEEMEREFEKNFNI